MNTKRHEVIEEMAVCLQGGSHTAFGQLSTDQKGRYRAAARVVLQRLVHAQREAMRREVLDRLAIEEAS